MIKQSEIKKYQQIAANALQDAGISLTDEERANIEIAELSLGEFERTGVSLVTYINTDYYCAKELVLLPGQTCPEHRHPSVNGKPGKMETFRCRCGIVYLYIPGKPATQPRAIVPSGSENCYSVFHEIILEPGQQYTIPENTLHWFQAGSKGAIVSEFSTTSRDESDIFTDTRIKRIPEIIEN
ncbi:MAG TPA: D-lyxose/D-mannose family sugar isomerase [Phycisphaerae bacterium]|nr:D-lyxose/D-mannose family sugar isomerase [Phycisphaerae bacterium]